MDKNTGYGDWAKQMLSDQGQGIEEHWPYLWHRGQDLVKTGRTAISDGKMEVPVNLAEMGAPTAATPDAASADPNNMPAETGDIDTRSHIVIYVRKCAG